MPTIDEDIITRSEKYEDNVYYDTGDHAFFKWQDLPENVNSLELNSKISKKRLIKEIKNLSRKLRNHTKIVALNFRNFRMDKDIIDLLVKLLNENEAIVSLAINSHNLTNLAYFIEKISPIEQLQELIISGTTKQVPGKSYFIYQPSDLDVIATLIKMKRSNLTDIILPMTQQCKNIEDIDEFLGDNLRNALAQNPYITRFNIGRINIFGVSPQKEKIIPRASVEEMLSKLHEPYHPNMLKQETEKTTISARKRRAHLLTVLSFEPTIDYTPHPYDCWQNPPFKTLKDCNDKFNEKNESQKNSPSDDIKERPANTFTQSNTLAPINDKFS